MIKSEHIKWICSLQTVNKLLIIEFVYSLFYFKLKLILKSLISIPRPKLSPGTARACSLERRAVPGGVTVSPFQST